MIRQKIKLDKLGELQRYAENNFNICIGSPYQMNSNASSIGTKINPANPEICHPERRRRTINLLLLNATAMQFLARKIFSKEIPALLVLSSSKYAPLPINISTLKICYVYCTKLLIAFCNWCWIETINLFYKIVNW